MKLNSFKFQDGKIFWLPEYPEKGPNIENFESYSLNGLSWFSYALAEAAYTLGIAKSLASAIEVAPEDADVVKIQIWWRNIWTHGLDKQHANQNTFNQIIELWQPEKDKVYSAECEMEITRQLVSVNYGRVKADAYQHFARLKPKDEIFPAANSHDMKEEEDLDK